MRSSSGGYLTTLLMLAPVIAIPALAIFGVPSGDGLKASLESEMELPGSLEGGSSLEPSDSQPTEPVELESNLGDGFLPEETGPTGDSSGDPFQESKPLPRKRDFRTASRDQEEPFGAEGLERPSARTSRGPRTRPNAPADTGNRNAAAEPPSTRNAFDEEPFGQPPETALPRGTAPRASSQLRATPPRTTRPPSSNDFETGSEANGQNLTAVHDWRSAALRLKELGVKEYLLQPGDGERQFVFTCRYVRPGNARVVRRFEAEADDPLDAVLDVLAQVERWSAQR